MSIRRLALVFALLCLVGLVACDKPSKPIKQINIMRAADYEPVQPAPGESLEPAPVEPPAAPPDAVSAAPAAGFEIVDVQGFRGPCDSLFAGINAEDLITMRAGSRISTYRLAGISIPEGVRVDAHNQIRRWLDRKEVSLEVDESIPSIDPAVYVHVCPDGMILNEELVRSGLAIPSEARFNRSDALKKASVEALTAGRGVWGRKK